MAMEQNSSALSDVILNLPFGGVGIDLSCRPSNHPQVYSDQLQFMDQMRPGYNHEVIQNGFNQHAVAPAERHFLQETIGITDRIYDRGGAEESTEFLQLQSIALNAECERQVIVESGPSARYYFQCNLKLIKKC